MRARLKAATYAGETYFVSGPDATAADLLDLMLAPDWHAQAACKGSTVHFCDGPMMHAKQAAAAKTICAGCPVIDQCRTEHVEKRREEFGVWAGMTPAQARNWRRLHNVDLSQQQPKRPHGTVGRCHNCRDGPNGLPCSLCHPLRMQDQRNRTADSRDRNINVTPLKGTSL